MTGLEFIVKKTIVPLVIGALVLGAYVFGAAGFARAADKAAAASRPDQHGIASTYGYETGSRTASGKRLLLTALTAAHKTLPFGTYVLVTNKRNGKTVTVEINDRGPFVKGRVIDVTPAAARVLGFSGLTQVSLAVVKAGDQRKMAGN